MASGGTASGPLDSAPTRAPAPIRRRVLAAVLGAATGSLVIVAAVGCAVLGWDLRVALESFVLTNAVMAVSFGGCGAILAWHRPANPIGWLFAAGGLLQGVAAAAPPLGMLAAHAGTAEPGLRLAATLFVYSWPWAIGACVPLALMLFPDGRPVSRRWRWVVVAIAATAPLFVLEMGASPQPVADGVPVAYLTVPFYDRLAPLWLVAEVRTAAAYLLSLIALALRYRRGDETTRRQLLWLLLAMMAVTAALLPWGLVAGTPVAVLFAVPLIPAAITLAVVRHQLLDIRLVISRAVAWLLLSLAVVVAYAVLVAVLDRVVSSTLGGSAVATVIVVLLAAPVLPRLQQLVDRALYGERANPARVVSRLGEQLATSNAGLSGVVGSIRSTLRLPYVALRAGDDVLAADGVAPEQPVEWTLTYGGQETGRLIIGLRTGERQLSEADHRVLDLLAAPLAVAVHATLVSEELRTSRVRLVEAREEERRRLRRELHDGLGPTLTGIAFTADAAANLRADADRVEPLLAALRRDSRVALVDVRRVVEDLRPPALDELGLVGAVRQRAEQLRWREGGSPVQIELDVPERLPDLAAAVEVAAYRVITEALTNVVRHSPARRVAVAITASDRLRIEVSDDGVEGAGRDDEAGDGARGAWEQAQGAWEPGVGLHAMRERTLEAGGSFAAGPSAFGGRVCATFPLGTT